ncbi:dihydrolipoamide acetyltransferase [Volvox carteri f. nagariensis]|uniref:Dihydrolipoamide acetyltransferase component of pyruvate dehydrogenase complex n=1 Tax=Volvox carteri f. nagariensis TaxID=3068 RepID=D8TUP1_VOLCA|nr:dihydrolipoamide acetyltransferase [Volvox carteri f. nagariensis]EFJ48742.1 dihydrolipoamide acetyltransferase [Volvox carteri f. nagariensis]|eukprot:XP_002950074.1 dihydrolipoamide acetyltransferase [Volvox carteri f. nagariensis]
MQATRVPAKAGVSSSAKAVPSVRAGRRCLVIPNAVKDVFMPALSSTMTEGKIVSWLKNVGDKVKKGEALVVVESDKADMDVESFAEGILGAIVVQEGERASVGAPIAFVAENASEVEEAKKKAAAMGAPAAAAPAAAPAAPAAPAPAPAPAVAPAPVPAARTDGRVVATPYAKQLAKELKVDLATVLGTGPNGRITAADVEARAAGKPAAPAAPAAAAPAPAAAAAAAAPAPAPAAAKATKVSELKGTTKPFTTLQAAVARNMNESLKVPEFRVSYSIVTDKLDALYQQLKPKGVTMTALLAKACGVALAKHPLLYAALPEGGSMTQSLAVSACARWRVSLGVPPVLKNADSTDIYQLSRNWADLVKRARSKQLQPDEYNSGTFTISNLGMYGVETFDAILPPGTAAILAVGGSKPTVVATADGMIGVKKVMNVNITADHRIVYGADAAEFLQTLKAVIESPEQLTM